MKPNFRPANSPARRRTGFTVIEVMLVAGLMSLLAVLVSGAWSGLGRSTVDTTARCRVVQEANLAAESLAQDLGGYLPGNSPGSIRRDALVGQFVAAETELWLCFDGNDNGSADWASPDTVVVYEARDNQLVRRDLKDATEFVVANNLDAIQLSDLGDEIRIALTFAYRHVNRTYTICTKAP